MTPGEDGPEWQCCLLAEPGPWTIWRQSYNGKHTVSAGWREPLSMLDANGRYNRIWGHEFNLYAPEGGAVVYYNRWDNSWTNGYRLAALPPLDGFCAVDVFDIGGRGRIPGALFRRRYN
ncbi:hypothetical protein EYZ11_012266 [Aspergillus tanneri]|uniref:Uncharacterized protein n=1 Tax=Aspergillus tanneri TaxID=1220188 RepID=A0A4S3J0Q0_9EURO|nr:hypothetical protein EYZ11_012266 [Aspergillus tanneri]